jgi:hypothetical protein
MFEDYNRLNLGSTGTTVGAKMPGESDWTGQCQHAYRGSRWEHWYFDLKRNLYP